MNCLKIIFRQRKKVIIGTRDAKQFWKKTVSTPKLELISEIAFNSMKQSFALKNFRPIFPILCSMHRQLQLGLNTAGSLPLKTKNLHYDLKIGVLFMVNLSIPKNRI